MIILSFFFFFAAVEKIGKKFDNCVEGLHGLIVDNLRL